MTAVWTPSAGRTVSLIIPTPLRGISAALVALSWPQKASADNLDYPLDLSAWLADADDMLRRFTLQISAGGAPLDEQDLAAVWVSVIGGMPVALLSGGKPGVTYTATLIHTTTGGRKLAVPITIGVNSITSPVNAGTPTMPPNALLGSDSAWLVADDGSQILSQ